MRPGPRSEGHYQEPFLKLASAFPLSTVTLQDALTDSRRTLLHTILFLSFGELKQNYSRSQPPCPSLLNPAQEEEILLCLLVDKTPERGNGFVSQILSLIMRKHQTYPN